MLLVIHCAISFQLFFRNRVTDEDGYILFVRKNALQILIPKYGLEGTVFLPDDKKRKKQKSEETGVRFEFDEEMSTQTCGDVTLHVFDPVRVQVSVDQTNVQHQRLQLKLVEPKVRHSHNSSTYRLNSYPCSRKRRVLFQIANFSVDPVEVMQTDEPPQKKSKAKTKKK